MYTAAVQTSISFHRRLPSLCWLIGSDPLKAGIEASPAALIPSRINTLRTVSHKICRSSQKLRLSTYHTSSANFSSQLIAFRPLTCAQPVIPGRTSCRRPCSGVYRGRYSISRGRGPTRLISPRSTFHNSGNSSRLLARKKRPKGVSRCASGSNAPLEPRSSVIVRNFIILKGEPCSPDLICEKNTGLPSFRRTCNAIRANGIANIRRPSAAAPKSKTRLTLSLSHVL